MRNPIISSPEPRHRLARPAAALVAFSLALTAAVATTTPAEAVGIPHPQEPRIVSQSVTANWGVTDRRRQDYTDLLSSLSRTERLTARVASVTPPGGGSPTNVIVIYGPNGEVRVCIGRPSACKELMK